MSIQEFMIWYQDYISSDLYLILNVVAIIFSFLAGKISAIIMRPELSREKYGDMVELLENDKNKLSESWKEAFTYFSKANTYLFLALFLIVQLVFSIILETEGDRIAITVLMFTATVSIMEFRDNRKEYKRREKVLIEEQLNLIMQAEDLKDMEFQDSILTELEKRGIIDKEKRKEIIKSMTN